ncbi:hypothetical protein Efla_004320 [Eimeria flavescens]
MAGFKFIVLVGVSLLSLTIREAASEPTPPKATHEATLIATGSGAHSVLSLQQQGSQEGVKQEAPNSVSQPQHQANKIYMYYPQSSNDTSCDSDVDYWKSAVTSFSTPPPAYSEAVYGKHTSISFVSLYNAGENPTVDCADTTCKKTQQDSSNSAGSTQGGPRTGEAPSSTTTSKYSMLCLTKPQALDKSEEPFTQEQWNKITGVENRSSHSAVFAVLAAAAAAVVHSLF